MTLRPIRLLLGSVRSSASGEFGTGRGKARQTEFGYVTRAAYGYKLALVGGFVLLAIGLFAAHRAPASGYEVSIYWATPRLYWIGAGGALLVAMTALLYDYRSRLAPLAMFLGLSSVASFLALPVIRNYYFHGYADPMTHLGRIRALEAGFITFVEPIYPGSYVVTVFLGSFSGLATNRSMLYVMFLFALVFLLFIPLTVRAIVPDRRAFVVGLFCAFLLLPVNNISLYYRFHPFSMTTMYFPLVAYLFVSHITHAHDDGHLPWKIDASTLLLPLAGAALVLFHPQATADLLIIFAMVVGVQTLVRWVAPDHPLSQYRGIYGQFALLMVVFFVWVSLHQGGTGRTIESLIDGLTGWISGDSQAASTVRSRADSADSVAVSLHVLFAKFFLVSAVLSAVASGVILAQFAGKLRRVSTGVEGVELDTVTIFAVGGMGLLPFIFLHSFGSADAYLFRHIGFWMVIVTILGAVGLYYIFVVLSMRLGDVVSVLRPVLGTLAAIMLVLSLLSVYSSPYLYLPGQHVSEQEMQGWETGFEIQPSDRSVYFGGVRQNANRYEAAMFAAPNVSWSQSPTVRVSEPVSDENLTRLTWHYENHPEKIVRRDQYMMVSDQDYRTEAVAYDGVRHTAANISSVDHQPDIYRIYSNGEARLYYVDTRGTPIINNSVTAGNPSGEIPSVGQPIPRDFPVTSGG